jgi:hypothetical protein
MRYLFIILVAFSSLAYGQDQATKPSYKEGHTFDLTVSGGDARIQGAAGWSHLHGFGKKEQRFKVGYGLRFASFAGGNLFYTTAPAKYTSEDAKIDTLSLINAQVNTLNVSIHLQYTLFKKLDLGFNIDAVGLSFGAEQKGSILSSSLDAGYSPVPKAKPTPLNILLVGDNDRGSLISEFYVRYWISPRWAVRGGFNYFFSEYTTDKELSFNNGEIKNDRFRNKSYMGFISVSFKPFAQK